MRCFQVQTWAKFAGSAKVDTFEKSAKQVKKQITATVSNVLYVRGLFDEDDYAMKSFDGVHLRIIQANTRDPMAQKVSSYLIGAFDALEKRYLRNLKMVIYLDPEKPDEAHEVYSVKVSYPDGLPALDDDGLGRVKRSTFDLLKNTLEITEGLDPLPNTVYLSFRMDYYDEHTPEDYEPPGIESHPRDLVLPEGWQRSDQLPQAGRQGAGQARGLPVSGPPLSTDGDQPGLTVPCHIVKI